VDTKKASETLPNTTTRKMIFEKHDKYNESNKKRAHIKKTHSKYNTKMQEEKEIDGLKFTASSPCPSSHHQP
jgi:hypothetical protein